MRSRAAPFARTDRIEWSEIALWALGFVLVAYLGLEGGGYDPLVHDRVGIAVWWFLLLAATVGALPRRRLTTASRAALGLLAAFVAWTALSLSWTESSERTLADLARVLGYLGVFGLALFGCGRDGARHLVGGAVTGIVLVASVGLLSRFEPTWFPAADQTAQLLDSNRERLSYPLHYWNGLAALLAVGVAPLLHFAAGARAIAVRLLAAAALPILVLTLFLTLSRGGIGAAAIAVGLYLVLAANRLPKLLTSLVAGAGGAVLCLAVASRDALHDGLNNPTAETQGDEMLLLTLGVCLVVAAAQAGLWALDDRWALLRPSGRRRSPRHYLLVAGVTAVAAAAVLLALGAPDRAADAWDEFKRPDSPGEGSGRLISAAGQNRYEYWQSAVDQNATEPLIGTGSGTFELWWARDRESADAVRDAHSLYMQTLGELGVVGLLLLVAFLFVVLLGGAVSLLRTDAERRSLLAAALAGCVAFCFSAAFDWTWQIPVIPVALLLLAAALLTQPRRPGGGEGGLAVPVRIGFAVVAAAAIVAIAIPLATASLLRESEADARGGDPIGALEAARSAENVQPGAAAPRLQQALVLEEIGDLTGAAAAAAAAAQREPTNWRNWLVLSRIEARQGNAAAAVDAYRRSRSLNPLSPLFER